MERYLIDTNSVSDYFSASLPEAGLNFMDTIIDSIPNISVITQIELLSWKTHSTIEENVKDFINDSTIFDISHDVVMRCIMLRRTKKIKTPDAIIAATALVLDYTLVTNNEKDFSGIEGLKIANPMKL